MNVRSVAVLFLYAVIQVNQGDATEYILPALGLGGNHEDTDTEIKIIISNSGTSGEVSPTAKLEYNGTCVAIESGTVNAREVRTFTLMEFNGEALLNRSELANKSLEVTDNGETFNLHVIYEKNGFSEGYAAISTGDVGNEYYVSTFCALGGYCQIAVAPVTAGLTQVYIKLPEEVDEVVLCVGQLYWRSKFHTTVNLTYPESLQIETTHDLTGTFIYSDQPISVIAGTRSMLNNNGNPLHFMEQLVPIAHWGTEFIVRGFETAYGCVLHITSHERKTVVKMSGFRTVEMTGKGQTLKRRVENYTTCHIRSNKPIQVMVYVGLTFGSADVIESVGMTTLPAIEHYKTRYFTYCETSPTTFFQYALKHDESVPEHAYSLSTRVYATDYIVNTVSATSAVEDLQTSNSTAFGGIFQCNTAIFPMSPTLTTPVGCSVDVAGMINGDGIDNDCDGQVDEDYCFENSQVTFTFIPGVSEKIEAYTANVTDFYEILLRVQTCGSVQVELQDDNNGKIVVHITWSQVILYLCFPDCTSFLTLNTTLALTEIHCESDVVSYWIMQHSGKICVDIGRRNLAGSCAGLATEMSLSHDLKEMRFRGLMNNATIWYAHAVEKYLDNNDANASVFFNRRIMYHCVKQCLNTPDILNKCDMYRTDCGKFSSDWRCHDAVGNCFEYEDDMCTNPNYREWVEQNCRKFCGLCSPDSFGKMFVFYSTPLSFVTNAIQLKIVGSYIESGRIGVGSVTQYKTTNPTPLEQRNTANVSCFTATIYSSFRPFHIFTDHDTAIYHSSDWNGLSSRPVLPLDALGTEYMTLTFSTYVVCIAEATEPGSTAYVYGDGVSNSYPQFVSFNEFLNSNGTGILITGNKPFAVFCGTMAWSEYGPSWYQLPPTSTWGTYYVTPSLGTNFSSDVSARIKVVANSDNTVIEIHGDFDGIYLLLARGDFKDFPTDPSISYNISSNFPIGVAIVFYEPNQKNSSFHIVPPTDSFMDNPVLLGYTDFIDSVTSLTSTPVTGNVTEYTFNDTDLPQGDFYFRDDYNASYLLFVREYPDRLDVTPSLSLFKDLSLGQICRLGNDSVGDGLDSDCDGLVDEETLCYIGYGSIKKDTDLDGAFGEDCANTEEGSGEEPVPEEPKCAPTPEFSNTSCLLNCKCSCSWAASLELYQNMNQSERDAYNQGKSDQYQKELEVDEETLSSTVAEKESAEDSRTSSQSIGYAGCIFIVIVLGCVVAFDLINVINKLRERRSRGEVQELK